MTIGAVSLSMIFYIYGKFVETQGGRNYVRMRKRPGRDMWVASLLDCEYEPAKVRFGPAKAIPAKQGVRRAVSDKSFSHYMSDK
jgi:hypothetical protein